MLPSFPEFLPLTIELKEPYNQAVSSFTPYSDISFATLQTWWNVSEQLSVSLLNQNLVINYSLFHDLDNSGLSLIGRHEIDLSIDQIFDFLKQSGQASRLVHVPEFTAKAIKNPGKYAISEELDYNEYILDSDALAKLEGPEYQTLRKKIKRFGRHVGDKQLEIKSLDLTLAEVQDELFKAMAEWENKNKPRNDPANTEQQALKKALGQASELDLRNLALYIDKQLHGIVIYHQPLGKEYYVLSHLKANYQTPYISDYLHHAVAKQAQANNVTRLNIEMDLGIENLRQHKMTLRPVEFFRKYTIKPAVV